MRVDLGVAYHNAGDLEAARATLREAVAKAPDHAVATFDLGVIEQTMGINYGFEKVRFMAPVKSGARVRGRFVLAEARFRGAGMVTIRYDVSVEIEDETKPALTADWITIIQFDPKDRPEGV